MHSRFSCRSYFNFKTVIMREIDKSIDNFALRKNKSFRVDYEKALDQKQILYNAFERLGLQIVIIPSDGHPDSTFIEDTAVIIDNTALITNPGAASRRAEVDRVREYLSSLNQFEMPSWDTSDGFLDGGDVLFTGSEIIVGRSLRSNDGGVQMLRKSFPQYPVVPIDIAELIQHTMGSQDLSDSAAPLHLKSFCSMYGANKVLVGGEIGRHFGRWLTERHARTSSGDGGGTRYTITHVPDEAAANCIVVNETLIRRTAREFPDSHAILSSLSTQQVEVECSELGKVDGALTCCALLF